MDDPALRGTSGLPDDAALKAGMVAMSEKFRERGSEAFPFGPDAYPNLRENSGRTRSATFVFMPRSQDSNKLL